MQIDYILHLDDIKNQNEKKFKEIVAFLHTHKYFVIYPKAFIQVPEKHCSTSNVYLNDKNIYIYFDKAVICYSLYGVCRDDDDDDTAAKRK